MPGSLVCAHVIFTAVAELRWLDHVEQPVLAAEPTTHRQHIDERTRTTLTCRLG